MASSAGGEEGAPAAAGRGEKAGFGGEDKLVLLRPFPEIPGRTRKGTAGSFGRARSSSWSLSAKHATDAKSPREEEEGEAAWARW